MIHRTSDANLELIGFGDAAEFAENFLTPQHDRTYVQEVYGFLLGIGMQVVPSEADPEEPDELDMTDNVELIACRVGIVDLDRQSFTGEFVDEDGVCSIGHDFDMTRLGEDQQGKVSANAPFWLARARIIGLDTVTPPWQPQPTYHESVFFWPGNWFSVPAPQ